jgi:phosphatidylglycerophosphate synthase
MLAAPRKRRSFGERLHFARSRRNEDWWSIVFGGPIAQLLTALVADVGWITPNLVTWLSFAAKLGAVPLLLDGSAAAAVAAIALLQANVVLDCLDGCLARYRGRSSALGAYLDKVTDAVGLAAVLGAFGVRVVRDTGDLWALAIVVAGAVLWLARIYAYWVLAFLERDGRLPTSTWRALFLSEADAYFWLGVALATGWLRPIAYLYGGGLAVLSIAVLIVHGRRAAAVDAWGSRR